MNNIENDILDKYDREVIIGYRKREMTEEQEERCQEAFIKERKNSEKNQAKILARLANSKKKNKTGHA